MSVFKYPHKQIEQMEYNERLEAIKRENIKFKKHTWKDFSESGLLWFINSILNLFGWSITFDIDIDTGEIVEAFPARTVYRGFLEETNTDGYKKVSNFLRDNIDDLCIEVEEY